MNVTDHVLALAPRVYLAGGLQQEFGTKCIECTFKKNILKFKIAIKFYNSYIYYTLCRYEIMYISIEYIVHQQNLRGI